MPVTEFVTISLKPGSEIGNPDNHAAPAVKEGTETIASQDGCQNLQFGTLVERPNELQLVINWDAIEKHHEFMHKPEYGPFLQKFGSVFAEAPKIHHANLEPFDNVAKALSAPVTEVATFFFEGAPPADYLNGFHQFREVVEKTPDSGYFSSAAGPTVEEIEHDGVKGKAIVLLIGWQSVDAHTLFRETQVFKDNISLLRSSSKAREVRHVAFMRPQ